MTRDAIKDRILAYIRTDKTNYAMMISGEWGAGKTHLLQNEIMPAIADVPLPNSDSKYRPVYVSLSGLSTTERLTDLMFASINLKPQKKETQLEFEIAQFDNQKSDYDFKPKSLIPQNIVFCFDDLERASPSFLEELLGYINTYIEHSENKVLFLADETKITEYFKKNLAISSKNFNEIKEKYIMRNYRLDANLDVILEHQNLSDGNKNLIKNTFNKGKWNNLRTLQLVLESLAEILGVFDSIKAENNNIAKYNENLTELIVFYTTFVSIEYKKGIPYYIIQSVNFPNRVFSLNEQDFDFSNILVPSTENQESIEETKNQKERKEIENLYFPKTGDYFPDYPEREHFDSIGEYIDSGEFKIEKFRTELEKITTSFIRREGTEDDKIRQKINSIYDVSDTDARKIITEVLELIKNTSYSKLSTYLSLFNDFLVFENNKVHDFKVDKGIVKMFIESIKKSISNNILKIEPFLREQTSSNWTKIDSLQSQKFHRFRECILKVNEELSSDTTDRESSVEAIIEAIGKNEGDLQKYVVESKDSYTLKDADALPIFEKLKESTPRAIDLFIGALNRRYELIGGHTQASYERGFINKISKLVDNHLDSTQENRPVSYLAFYNLKKKIEYWIKHYSLNNGKN